MFDREMHYLAVSRQFLADYRLPLDTQLIGRSHYEVFPDLPQRWRDIHARVLAGDAPMSRFDRPGTANKRLDGLHLYLYARMRRSTSLQMRCWAKPQQSLSDVPDHH
jgi:hypothetical protein